MDLLVHSKIRERFKHSETSYGKSLYYQDSILYIKIEQVDSNNYQFTALYDIYDEHEVKFKYDNSNKDIYDTYCCYWSNYNDREVCGHIYATLLHLKDVIVEKIPTTIYFERYKKIQERIKLRNRFASASVINFLKQNDPILLPTTDKLSIDANISINEYAISVDFKIGDNKKYVIKNVSNFLDDLRLENDIEFGKNLTAKLKEDSFDDNSKEIIKFMEFSCLKSNDEITRFINVSPYNIDEFYKCFANMDEYKDYFAIDEEKFPLIFDLVENGYVISGTDSDLVNNNFYYVNNNKLYCKENKKNNFIQKYLEIIRSVIIVEEHIPDLYYHFIQENISYLDIKGYDFSNFERIENIEVFGDVDDNDYICFELTALTNNGNRIDENSKITNSSYEKIKALLNNYAYKHENNNYIYNKNDEKVYRFINYGLENIKEYANVYISEKLKMLNKQKKYHITIQVGVNVANLGLDLEINSDDLPENEISDILKAYRRKKRYYRLKSGDLINLYSDDLANLDEFLDDMNINLNQIKKGKVSTNLYRSLALNNEINEYENINFEKKPSYENLLTAFNNTKALKIKEKYQNILREYQIEGINWINTLANYHFNGILADDMGLGKTLQIIAYLDSLEIDKPSLVICPSSLILNWHDEILKFAPDMQHKLIIGNANNRKEQIETINNEDKIVITSYDYMRKDYIYYENIDFYYIILDEAQYIKNQKTKNSISVKSLKSEHRLALTGTPIENNIAELWSIFDFLMNDYLYNYNYFKTHYENPIAKNNDSKITNKLKTMVSPFILKKIKKDVLKELPEKIEQVINVEFSENEHKLYNALFTKFKYQINNGEVDKFMILSLLTKLRQICIEPRLLYDNIYEMSSKMQVALDIIENYQANHKKLLLFSSFTSVFDLFFKELNKRNIKYLCLTGSTPKEKRKELVDKFQNSDEDTLFMISLKAGGTGLNLTAAEAVIHFDPWWNTSAQNQATDRIYRIGQLNNVIEYKLIMKDSIEEKILNIQNKKKELIDALVENNQSNLSKMSIEELLSLFE